MKAQEFVEQLKKSISPRTDVALTGYHLSYKEGVYPFVRLASKIINPTDSVMLIRAGIHGDEVSGPLAILNHANEIFDYAHQRGVKLIVYPLGNPSGFEKGLRYNVDNDRGDYGSNDFIRYQRADGTFLAEDPRSDNEFTRWLWSTEAAGAKLAIETVLMHQLLRADPLTQIKAVADLHQDYLTPAHEPGAYHYSFGDLSVYQPIVDKIKLLVPLVTNTPIGAGYNMSINTKSGAILESGAGNDDYSTNNQGFIVRHDGTITDVLYRLGVIYNITSETFGVTTLGKAIEVNLVWIYGLIDLIS